MIDLIRELYDDNILVLPIKVSSNKFVHPIYSDKFDSGFTFTEVETLVNNGYGGAIAVIHGKCNPHLICLDFDEKNAPGKNLFETWRHMVDPYVYKKLVVEKTKSAGYHVYFKCSVLPPEKALASSAGNEEWIAARSARHDGITYCAPSPGYTELQGSLLDLQEVTPQEMMDLCDAAMQLNEYTGAHSAKGTQLPVVSVPSQYAVVCRLFDTKIPASFTIEYLEDLGWRTDGTVKQKMRDGNNWEYVRMWRPGREPEKEMYSANYWLASKKLSVFTASTPLPAFDSGLNFSHSPSQVLYHMAGRDWQATYNAILDLCTKYDISLPEATPMAWLEMKGKTMAWKVEVKGILEWAEREGYRWMSISGNDDSVVQLVRVVDNIIYEVDDKDLLRCYRNEIEKNYAGESLRVLSNFLPSVMSYMNALPLFDLPLMRDDRKVSYLYFANGVLKVSAETTELLKYSELAGCVFARHIKDFDYKEMNEDGVFGEFIDKIVEDADHKKFLMSALGYVMHYHKLRSFAKALMIIEDVEDQEEARGRSGKGLLAQFVEWCRWTVQQDGRNFKGDSQFKMQQLIPGVQVYYLNDPAPGVLMNQFYNYITDDWLVEAKGKKAYSIPYKNSPKILITTNYIPNIESDSDKDRFIILPIKKVFGAKYAVRDAFPGVIFFDESWRQEDALGAVRFAVSCLQMYLKEGISSYENERMTENANRRVIASTVPQAVIESIEQAIDCSRGAKNREEFMLGIRMHDLMTDKPETMTKAFDWLPDGLVIFVSRLYQYCLAGYKMKNVNDKLFGKKVRTYLEKSGFKEVEEVRNNTVGRRIVVKRISAMNSAMKTQCHENVVQCNEINLDKDKFIGLDMEDF